MTTTPIRSILLTILVIAISISMLTSARAAPRTLARQTRIRK